MKKNDCNVVRDLMPLVIDRAASDESREFVEAHIVGCAECREQYDAMKADLPDDTRAEYEEEQKQFMDALKAVRKKKRRRRTRRIALTALCCTAAVLLGLFAYDALFWKYTSPVDNGLYSLSMSELKDGRYVVTVDAGRTNFDTMTESTEVLIDGRYIMYERLQTTPIHAAGLPEGTRSLKWDSMVIENDGEGTVDEIRQGTPRDYITIWKKGDPIPAASEEMERYYALEKAYVQWMDSLYRDENGNINIVVNDAGDPFFAWQDRLEEARQAVPEWK